MYVYFTSLLAGETCSLPCYGTCISISRLFAGYPFQLPFAKRLKHSCNYDLQWPWTDSVCFVIFGDWRYPNQKTSNITFFGDTVVHVHAQKTVAHAKKRSRANQSCSITHQFCTPWRFLNYWVLSGWLSRTDLLIQLVLTWTPGFTKKVWLQLPSGKQT